MITRLYVLMVYFIGIRKGKKRDIVFLMQFEFYLFRFMYVFEMNSFQMMLWSCGIIQNRKKKKTLAAVYIYIYEIIL